MDDERVPPDTLAAIIEAMEKTEGRPLTREEREEIEDELARALQIAAERASRRFAELSASPDRGERRRGPEAITREVLRDTPDDELYGALFEFAIFAPKPADSNEADEKRVKQLPRGLRMLFAAAMVEGEVHNGGFNQYFANKGSRFAGAAVEALRRFGASRKAELVSDALARYEEDVRRHGEFRGLADSCDAYCRREHVENLEALVVRYAREHPEEFLYPAAGGDEAAHGGAESI